MSKVAVPVETIAEMLRELLVCGESERVVGANNNTGHSLKTSINSRITCTEFVRLQSPTSIPPNVYRAPWQS